MNLHPDIEEDCRSFLHTYCAGHARSGEELRYISPHWLSVILSPL